MCGFAGYISENLELFDAKADNILRDMAGSLIHRGPDSDGYWIDGSKGVALSHRRLAIVDLSDAGIQPMQSRSGRYTIALNGEVYNHMELRKLLEVDVAGTIAWKGHSDTESLLAFIEHWGLSKTISMSKGMFAFGLWDSYDGTMTLVRDRFGEKPLYYGWQGSHQNKSFMFASDLSALKKHPSFENRIDREALSEFVQFKNVPGTRSIYAGINKLSPGCELVYSLKDNRYTIHNWWSSRDEFTLAKSKKCLPLTEAVSELEKLLAETIAGQMQADVPLGAFLSGGIDSSLIASLMQQQSMAKIKTFSIGFNERSYDEAVYARSVASHLGTEHIELYVTAKDAQSIIPELPKIYSEPFADSSQIPTYLVSRLAREHVKVALSGDAGDELFCGYNRYKLTSAAWSKLKNIPLPIRNVMSSAISSINTNSMNAVGALFGKNLLGDKLLKGRSLLVSENANELYQSLISDWNNNESVVLGLSSDNSPQLQDINIAEHDMIEEMMFKDVSSYLVDDILVKVDRAAMANSLETRVPFLDHDVVKFAWQLPIDYKLRNGVTKWPLRKILDKYVPNELIDRPKMGFGVPIDQWLRGSLRDWAEDLLDPDRLSAEGYFEVQKVRETWREHLSGKRNWQSKLWNILMFQAWLEHQKHCL